ncbi:MAG: hypothetical protein JWO09_139 [Bacteroidetes bacterium]|nr:hypothetical protein [Bacteroidota bacterium]
MTGGTHFVDARTGFIYQGRDESYIDNTEEVLYEIHGEIFEQNTHSMMSVDYCFKQLSDANEYLDQLAERFPLSLITITKKVNRLCRFRG